MGMNTLWEQSADEIADALEMAGSLRTEEIADLLGIDVKELPDADDRTKLVKSAIDAALTGPTPDVRRRLAALVAESGPMIATPVGAAVLRHHGLDPVVLAAIGIITSDTIHIDTGDTLLQYLVDDAGRGVAAITVIANIGSRTTYTADPTGECHLTINDPLPATMVSAAIGGPIQNLIAHPLFVDHEMILVEDNSDRIGVLVVREGPHVMLGTKDPL